MVWSPEKGRLGASALTAGGGPADNSKSPPVCDCGSDWHGSLLPLSPLRSACSASTNFAHLEQHCREIGGRCMGKGQECTGTAQHIRSGSRRFLVWEAKRLLGAAGVLRGKCGPDCYCCVGDGGNACDGGRFVNDTICDMDCIEHAAESEDCKGMSARFNTAANCPDNWLGDGECDEECSTPANQW